MWLSGVISAGVGKSKLRLARDVGLGLGGRSPSPVWSGGCRGRVRTVPFVVKDSPRVGRPVRGGQASQWRPSCALHTTMSVNRTSCGSSMEMRRALSVGVESSMGWIMVSRS